MVKWTTRKLIFLFVLIHVLVLLLGLSMSFGVGIPDSPLIDESGLAFACILGLTLPLVCWFAFGSGVRSLRRLLIAATPALGLTNGLIAAMLVGEGGLNIIMMSLVYVMLGVMALVLGFAIGFPSIPPTLVAGNLIGDIMGAFWFFLYESVGVIKRVNHYWRGVIDEGPTFHTTNLELTICELVVIPIVVTVCVSIFSARVSRGGNLQRAGLKTTNMPRLGVSEQSMPQMCPLCGGTLTFVQQYQTWYCYACQKYV